MERLFPCFADVARNVREILDSSEYDAENKGAYKGSLLTRLNSLTNGLNGMMLSSNEVDASVLFDANTVIDLSRIGSAETKSLLMGLFLYSNFKNIAWPRKRHEPATSPSDRA